MQCDHDRMANVADDLTTWPDARLLAAASGRQPDSAALDALVRRHSRALQRRCRMLTSDRDRAADLAQETWGRMLRARATLRGEGSFGAYLAAIALNVWRDERRVQLRARELSEHRLLSFDASGGDGADTESLIAESILGAASPEHQLLLRLDLGYALRRLPDRLRAVVIARHVRGESAADIGRRYGRTEQTVTAWLRDATARMQQDLRDWRSAA